jgi:8-oxo-dGTP pyrophosphatase MutT (NUDIX family)
MSRCGIPTDGAGPAELHARVGRNLAPHSRDEIRERGLKAAAVAIALVRDDAGVDCFILIRRARRLRAHAGQWALPGGRLEHSESPVDAALRELEEEVGLRCAVTDVLGLLDDYPTRSGFSITPVVVGCVGPADLRPDPVEVAEIHRVAVAELLKPGIPGLRLIPQSERPVISIPLVGTQVHAPTAAILYQFREVGVLNRCTRVSQFEQPVFAWK